ncbi:hypothetical protein BU17DRAFT_76869 [Hysterangium stoloniferum]|nr:hypothetical protein BU17DRAFT_76869 [Hysterangium stoloniferum]
MRKPLSAGLLKDGQQNPAPDQVASLTSPNNFINFCLTQKDVPLTNGAQIKSGSCCPTIMGRIIGQDVMPATKFVFPPNLDESIEENQSFTIKLAVSNLQTGNFVNAQSNYFAAPAQVNNRGHLIGHSHVVIQAIPSLGSTDIADPRKFAFFQGLNAKASNSILTATVKKGLPAGVYRLGSITTAANHQPALVGVAQHGIIDDAVYFTVVKAESEYTRQRDRCLMHQLLRQGIV